MSIGQAIDPGTRIGTGQVLEGTACRVNLNIFAFLNGPKILWHCHFSLNPGPVQQVGVIQKKKKSYTFFFVPNCCRTPIPKCHALMLNFHLSQGLRKFGLLPSNEQQKNLFIKFKGCTSNKICSLACLKAKTGEKPTTFCVSPCTDQKPF